MKNKKMVLVGGAVVLMLLTSACGAQTNNSKTESAGSQPTESTPASSASPNSEDTDKEILIIIDQTPKPIAKGGAFDFGVKKVPEGYSLDEVRWTSDAHKIVDTVQEMIEHGANGGGGFYISGNGQFMGFFYADAMKGEKGEVSFLFKNDQGKELTWKKELTLN